MSFFSNPLAEEEEIVPPDYPLEQYDERKREDDFNELLVRATRLEAEQRPSAGAAALDHPSLVKCLQQNEQIRTTLEEKWAELDAVDRRRLTDKLRKSEGAAAAASSGLPSPGVGDVVDAVSARMEAQAAQREALAAHLSPLVAQAAAPLVTSHESATPGTAASPYTVLHHGGSSADSSLVAIDGPDAAVVLTPAELREIESAVQSLEAQLPVMSAEEAALATAAVEHLHSGLQSVHELSKRHAALRQRVRAKAQEQREAELAAQTFAQWTAARQLQSSTAETTELSSYPSSSSSSVVASAVPPLSFDLAVAEALNKELNEENRRLEVVLARLLADHNSDNMSGSSPPSLAGSALVQYVGLQGHARELEEETERLGRAVLCLRSVLADPSYAEAHDLLATAAHLASSTHDEAQDRGRGIAAAAAAAAAMQLWSARITQLHSLEKSLQLSADSQQSTASTAAADATSSASAILLLGLSKLREMYDACLHALALLSTYFEKQSASAAFLVCAMRGGGALDDATMERVLDVPLPDADDDVQRSVAEVAATCTSVAEELQQHVTDTVAASRVLLERWQSIRALLLRLLQENAAAVRALAERDGDVAGLAQELDGYVQRDAPLEMPRAVVVADRVVSDASWATATLKEEAEAFKVEKAAQRAQLKELWLTQQAEANKKLTWFMKQPNAPLLLQLCAAEKERDEAQQQLDAFRSAQANTTELEHSLNELRDRVDAATRHNAALQEELDVAQTRRRELEEERASLIASLS